MSEAAATKPVVLDACVLADFIVADLFLRLAESPAVLRPRWSETLLAETGRTHRKLGWPEAIADSWQEVVREHFPEARVKPDERLLHLLGNHPKDRHVLAAAIEAQAGVIVTYNLRDFPSHALTTWGVRAVGPDAFLLETLRRHPVEVGRCAEAMARRHSWKGLLTKWRRRLPEFAKAMEDGAGEEGGVEEEAAARCD